MNLTTVTQKMSMIMTEQEAMAIFSQKLDTYFEPLIPNIEVFCWFAEDFSRYKEKFVEEICDRILRPRMLTIKQIEQPILPLFYLIDAICKKSNLLDYQKLFANHLPTLYENAFRRKEEKLTNKLIGLINIWGQNEIFSDQILSQLSEIQRKMITEPQQAQLAQEKKEEEILKPQIVQPVYVSMPTIQQSIALEPITPQSVDERRLCRSWMRTALDWESSLPLRTELMQDINMDDAPQQNESIAYIPITPDNQNARCCSCSGLFDKEINPETREWSWKGAEITSRGEYIHQKCRKLESNNNLLDRLFKL